MKNELFILACICFLSATGCNSTGNTPAADAQVSAPADVISVSDPVAAPVPLPSQSSSPNPSPSATSSPSPTPSASPSATPTATVTASNADHACSIMSDASIECSGNNTYDQAPGSVTGVAQPESLAIGTSLSCSLTTGKDVYCWGEGAYLGNGTNQGDSATPIETVATGDITLLAAYGNYACAIHSAFAGVGTPTCWGSDASGTNETAPQEEVGVISETITQLAVGNQIKCALGTHLYCWNDSHGLTQQTFWAGGTYTGISANASGQMCVTGTLSGNNVSNCFSAITANGQL